MEIRAIQEGQQKRLVGYAATYGKISREIPDGKGGTFREKILPNAFRGIDSSRAESHRSGCDCETCGIACLMNHDDNLVLGRVGAGTLKLRADDKGLRFEVTLPDTTYANDLYENVQQGNMGGCSFSFNTVDVEDRWNEAELDDDDDDERSILSKVKKFVLRTISRFRKLREISIVSFPAYGGTSVSARSLAAATELRARLGLPKQPDIRQPVDFDDAHVISSRSLILRNAIHASNQSRNIDGNGLVDIILEARKLAAKTELNKVEDLRFWFCVHAITAIKKGKSLAALENDYRNGLLKRLGESPVIN